MSRQKDRITRKLRGLGMDWAISSGKFCGANDPLEDQIRWRQSYHIHPDVAEPRQSYVKRFDSLKAIEEWLAGQGGVS